MNKYRLISLRNYSLNNYLLSLPLALIFFTIEQRPTTISSIIVFYPISTFDLEIPRISCLVNPESFLDRDDSFPLDEGLIVGSYSIFFKEFFLIKVGLLAELLASAYS